MSIDGRYAEKKITWADRWSDVVRNVFYPDEKLKELMLVPEGTTIVDFVSNYFVEDISPDELLTDEKVRVSYYDEKGINMGAKNVFRHYKVFDIFVQRDYMNNATNDRLQQRTHLIADRIKYLLLHNTYVCNLRFEYEDEFNLWTKVVGYKRYSVTFAYKKTI